MEESLFLIPELNFVFDVNSGQPMGGNGAVAPPPELSQNS